MQSLSSRGLLAVAAVAAALTLRTTPSHATPVTFAQAFQQDGAVQEWSITTSGTTTTITANGASELLFSGVRGLPFSGPEAANFTFTATSTIAGACGTLCGPGDSFAQNGYSGSFAFIDAGATPGADLLSGTFSVTSLTAAGGQFAAIVGGNGSTFVTSATPSDQDQLTLSSDFLTFPGFQQTASFSLSSLIPSFETGPEVAGFAYPAQGTFTAAGTGTFSSNPAPIATVEPPAALSFMVGLLGLGFVAGRRPTSRRQA
jgi:hypothetical protein